MFVQLDPGISNNDTTARISEAMIGYIQNLNNK